MAFALSHFAGIFLTSTAITVVYSLYKRNKPQVFPQSIMPALFAGTLWGVAQSGWFVGNANLGLTVGMFIHTHIYMWRVGVVCIISNNGMSLCLSDALVCDPCYFFV